MAYQDSKLVVAVRVKILREPYEASRFTGVGMNNISPGFRIRSASSHLQFHSSVNQLSWQNVNRYESGTTPHTDFLIQLALKEHISIDWLLLGKGRMRRSR